MHTSMRSGNYGIIEIDCWQERQSGRYEMGAPGKAQDQVDFIAAKVDQLFRTITRPTGKQFTYREVAEGSGLSLSYIRKLRVGKVAHPSRGVLDKLSMFFGVTPDYWFRTDDTIPMGTQQDHQVGILLRKIADASLNEEQLGALDEMIDEMLAQSLKLAKPPHDE